MTTSATTSYNLSAQDIINLALSDIGANGPGTTADANLLPHALKLLNIVIKRLDIEGAPLWRTQRRTLTMTSGTANYVVTNDVSDIQGYCRYTQVGSTYGSQVVRMARDEYMRLPDRTTQGRPFRYYPEKALDTNGIEFMTIYLYPVPSNTGDTLEYAAVVRALDVTNVNQTLDIPQKWLNVIRYGLAFELCSAYNVPPANMQMLKKMYDDEREAALNDDNEHGDVQLVPFGQQYGYRYGYGTGGGY